MVQERIAKSYSVCNDCVFHTYGSTNHFRDTKHTGLRYYLCLKTGCLQPEHSRAFTTFTSLKKQHESCSGVKVRNHQNLAWRLIHKARQNGLQGRRLDPGPMEACIMNLSEEEKEEEEDTNPSNYSFVSITHLVLYLYLLKTV